MRVLYGFADTEEANSIVREAEEKGFETIGIIDSGEELYYCIVQECPDLIVTDLCLAEYDFCHVLEQLAKNHKEVPPVILVTSIRKGAVLQEAVRLSRQSVFLCVYQPVKPTYLVSRMQMICQRPELSWSGTRSMSDCISDVLQQIGISMKTKGACYLRDSIALCIEDPVRIYNLKQEVAPIVCKNYKIKYSTYQVGMQRTIQEMDVNGHLDALQRLFPNYTKYELHNMKIKDLISKLVNEYQRQMEENMEDRILAVMDELHLDCKYSGYSILRDILDEALRKKNPLFEGTQEEYQTMISVFRVHPDTRAWDYRLTAKKAIRAYAERNGLTYGYVYQAIDRLLEQGRAVDGSWWAHMQIKEKLPVRVMLPIMVKECEGRA